MMRPNVVVSWLATGVLCTVWVFAVPSPASAKEPLSVSLAVKKGGELVAPFGDKITVTQQPLPFYLVVKNVSSSSAEIPVEDVFAFEVTESNGRRVIVQRKTREGAGSRSIFIYLSPGEQKSIKVVISPGEWENVPVMEEGKAVEYTVRAIYKGMSKKIYSPSYSVILGYE